MVYGALKIKWFKTVKPFNRFAPFKTFKEKLDVAQ